MNRSIEGSLIVIGENLHATRSVKRDGPLMGVLDGGPAVRFVDRSGTVRHLPLAGPILDGSEFATGKVKHIRNALLVGMGAAGELDPAVSGPVTPDAGTVAREYLVSIAARQADAGAAYIDLNVDELSADTAMRSRAIAWLVSIIEPEVGAAMSIDSSSPDVLAAGVRACLRSSGAPLINSASLERPEVLDFAASEGCPVVASAVGRDGMPSNAAERVANALEIVAAATARGLRPDAIFVDPLVVPVAVEPEAGSAFLASVRTLREALGPGVHITGGLSNVSFGLPARRLVNDVFVALAIEAGVDSGIIDPLSVTADASSTRDPDSEPVRLARALLAGEDVYGVEFLTAFRRGRLDVPAPVASRG